MSRKQDGDSEDDAAIFRNAVGRVRPVTSNRVAPKTLRPRPVPLKNPADKRKALSDSLGTTALDANVQAGDRLEFHREGIPRMVLTKLRRGRFRIEAEIDLHGMTAGEAMTELMDFLHESHQRGLRCVRIIHGKGLRSGNAGPVLKAHVAGWLTQCDEVLAYVSARSTDGGTGAVYVLLR